MNEPWLIIETSSRGGQIGLSIDGVIAHSAQLDPTRRNNRDLAPTTGALLQEAGILPKQLTGVMVSQGPGSFTGLRVGVMSAKMLAYATGCKLIAVPTFCAIAEQTPSGFQLKLLFFLNLSFLVIWVVYVILLAFCFLPYRAVRLLAGAW